MRISMGVSFFVVFLINCLSLPVWGDQSLVESEKKNIACKQFIKKIQTFKIGKSVSEIRENFGKPIKIEITTEKNPYSNQKNFFYTYYFRGIKINFMKYHPEEESIFLISFEVSSFSWPLNPIKIGMSKKEVINYLGASYEEKKNGVILYSGSFEAEISDQVEFAFKNGKLTKVTWFLYTG